MKSRAETVLLQALLAAIGCVPAACGARTLFDGVVPSGAAADGGTTKPPAVIPDNCHDPKPVISDATGFVSCSNGFVHRPEIRNCPNVLPRAGTVHLSAYDACSADSQCTEKPHGFCDDHVIQVNATFCNYGCVSDSECAAGEICECGEPVGKCRPTSCKSDGDCAPGKLCSSFDAMPECLVRAFACQTSNDMCAGDPECGSGNYCTMVGAVRACSTPHCIIGRPYLVAGQVRVAPPVPSRAWSDTAAEAPLGLSSEDCVALERHWLEAAQLEHASVAAFARFQLQMLRHGAPPELLEHCASAMMDEIAHARIGFALAKRYGGAALGPGELEVGELLGSSALDDIVCQTVQEGCIGETVAAFEAAEAADLADDREVVDALRRIAADETRHAALAYRFVAWAVRSRPALAAIVEQAFEEAIVRAGEHSARSVPGDESASPTGQTIERRRLAHGLLPESMRQRIRARALRAIVGPCRAALASIQPSSEVTLSI